MNQNLSWLEKFVDKISQLLKEPPYHLFTFIGAVLVIITLIIRYNFNYTWAFFYTLFLEQCLDMLKKIC
jgi:type II secretory pathway component PulF